MDLKGKTETVNQEVQKVNRMRYEIETRLSECRRLRSEVYGYIKKFRSYFSSCYKDITPIPIVKEHSFEPLELLLFDKDAGCGESELFRKCEEYQEALRNHSALLNCFHTCLLEAERSYRELISAWELIASYFEAVGIGTLYKEGRSDQFLEKMEVKYTPEVCGYGGATEQRFQKNLQQMMTVKMILDELLYVPQLQKPVYENSKFDRIELLQILNRLLNERKKLEISTILSVKQPTVMKINTPFFTKDELYDEFVCAWEED